MHPFFFPIQHKNMHIPSEIKDLFILFAYGITTDNLMLRIHHRILISLEMPLPPTWKGICNLQRHVTNWEFLLRDIHICNPGIFSFLNIDVFIEFIEALNWNAMKKSFWQSPIRSFSVSRRKTDFIECFRNPDVTAEVEFWIFLDVLPHLKLSHFRKGFLHKYYTAWFERRRYLVGYPLCSYVRAPQYIPLNV